MVASNTERPARLLVVEDDMSIAMGLRINLEKEGYEVIQASDGEDGLEAAITGSPDLVILDVMLPRKNGFEILNELRSRGYTMPIIVLSAKTSEMDKVAGLELGAEDYVAKPFSLAELLARVRAALRRATIATAKAPRHIVFGDVRIDIDAREVRRGDQVVDFTQTEFDVLMCLVDARGKALSREAIFRKVWGQHHHGTTRTVDNFLQQLRSKLEPNPAEPRHFHTVRGVGYRFDA
ncbi:MAG: response regulator transcription factor [Polyangiaceae bacterium]|jgi:DNA-binding response OmpR family regulator|nr:response regulator transcription factor [Polyangiaceae bacterium]